MAAASTFVLIAASLLMGLLFLTALVMVLVTSSRRRGTWTAGARSADGHDATDPTDLEM